MKFWNETLSESLMSLEVISLLICARGLLAVLMSKGLGLSLISRLQVGWQEAILDTLSPSSR